MARRRTARSKERDARIATTNDEGSALSWSIHSRTPRRIFLHRAGFNRRHEWGAAADQHLMSGLACNNTACRKTSLGGGTFDHTGLPVR